MHGELAQLVGLVVYGSAYLADGHGVALPELFPDSSLFQFANRLEFRRQTRRLGVFRNEAVVANDCTSWFAHISRHGAQSIHLVRPPARPRPGWLAAHVEAGFSGGANAVIEVRYSSGNVDSWAGTWAVDAPNHPERRIWSVVLTGTPGSPSADCGSSVDEARYGLERALTSAISLVDGRAHYEFWESVFRDAYSLLSSPSPQLPYYHELLAPARNLVARQLLAAASRAWVFGGMGSWNDVGIVDEPEYDRTTRALYSAVFDGVLAAANAPVEFT
jgi:hypothetical protein